MTISARAKKFARDNIVSEENIDTMAPRFVDSINVTPEEVVYTAKNY